MDTGLSPDIHALLLALVVGVLTGFTLGGLMLALRSGIRAPWRGVG